MLMGHAQPSPILTTVWIFFTRRVLSHHPLQVSQSTVRALLALVGRVRSSFPLMLLTCSAITSIRPRLPASPPISRLLPEPPQQLSHSPSVQLHIAGPTRFLLT